MIVDSSVLGELGRQVWRKNVRKVRILGGDLCRSLLGNQAGYLRPPERVDIKGRNQNLLDNQAGYLRSLGRVDIEGHDKRGGTEGRDMNYVSLMFWIECCRGELLLTHQLDVSGSWEGLLGSVSSPPEVSTEKIDVCIAQDEERYFKDYFRIDISQQKGLFKESYSICFVHY